MPRSHGSFWFDGTTHEIYGPGSVDHYGGPYITYQYDANGVSQKSSINSSLLYAISNTDDSQIVGSTLYTDYGQGVNAESGALLGTFYSSGTTVAQGALTVDPQLHKAFILEGSAGAFGTSGAGTANVTLGAFNTADYSATPDTPISVTIPVFRASYQYAGPTGARLTRWGSNGLAFRGTGGFVSLCSSLVQDLSSANADVAVAITPPSTASTGTNATFTATVTNNGPLTASSISLISTVPSSGALLSVVPSTGSCNIGPAVVCNLGGMANGASASVVFTVLPTSAGTISLSSRVSASENDTVLSNNLASGSVSVSGGTYNLFPALISISPGASQLVPLTRRSRSPARALAPGRLLNLTELACRQALSPRRSSQQRFPDQVWFLWAGEASRSLALRLVEELQPAFRSTSSQSSLSTQVTWSTIPIPGSLWLGSQQGRRPCLQTRWWPSRRRPPPLERR